MKTLLRFACALLISVVGGTASSFVILQGRKSISVSAPILSILCILFFLTVWCVGFERGDRE